MSGNFRRQSSHEKTEQMTSHKAGFHPRISALYGPVLAAVRENSLRFSPELTLEKLRRSTLTVLKANGGGGGGGGGGYSPFFELYRYVRPQRVWIFWRFSHK